MDWTEALEATIARTGHARYRALCADDHPDHRVWRARVVELAAGAPAAPPPTAYPPAPTQLANLAGAIGRVVSATVHGGPVRVSPEEFARRLDLCRACPDWDEPARRCRRCGCFTDLKLTMATESCPLDPPRWVRVG